jgi:hypothetical protein
VKAKSADAAQPFPNALSFDNQNAITEMEMLPKETELALSLRDIFNTRAYSF